MSLLDSLTIPVIQAPMAGVSTPALAAAVSAAGGLGSLGLGSSNAAQAAAMMDETQTLLGSNRYAVNLFCHQPPRRDAKQEAVWLAFLAAEFRRVGAPPPLGLGENHLSLRDDGAMLSAVIAARPAMISFHFGLPRADQLQALRNTGAFLAATATSPAEAIAIRAAGLDAVIAQGYEAGGHRGIFDPLAPDDQLPLTTLVTQLLPLGLPVIAAGGLMDGADVARICAAGAVAAQMGTAFVACPESAASAAHRARLGQPQTTTVMTRAISGRPARGLPNRLTELEQSPRLPGLPDYPLPYHAARKLAAAGGSDYAAQWAGVGASRARALPAAQLMARLREEWLAARTGC